MLRALLEELAGIARHISVPERSYSQLFPSRLLLHRLDDPAVSHQLMKVRLIIVSSQTASPAFAPIWQRSESIRAGPSSSTSVGPTASRFFS
jgi:hypothetical protein